MSKIEINYRYAISQAKNISSLAEAYEKEIVKLENMKQEITMNWKSPAALVFLNEFERLREEMGNNCEKMRKLSETIEDIATRIKRQDDKEAERARQLNRI